MGLPFGPSVGSDAAVAGGVDAGEVTGPDTAAAPDAGPDGPTTAACTPWWRPEWGFRRPLALAPDSPGLSGWRSLVLDHAGLVARGQARHDGADLRVVRWTGNAWLDVPVQLDGASAWNRADTQVWFHGGASGPAFLYHGHPQTASGTTAPRAILRSVQTGILATAGGGRQTAAVAPVDPARATVFYSTRSAGFRPPDTLVRVSLADPRTIELVREEPDASRPIVEARYFLLDWAGGVGARRGQFAQTTATVTVDVEPLRPELAFLTFGKTPTKGDEWWDHNDPVRAAVVGPTRLDFRVGRVAALHHGDWQLTSFASEADARVWHGSAFLDDDDRLAEVPLPTGADPARSFLLASFAVVGNHDDAACRMIAGSLEGGRLRFERGRTADGEDLFISWQVVELRDGARVFTGRADLAAGELRRLVPLALGAPQRAVALGTVSSGGGLHMGATPRSGRAATATCTATFAVAPEGLVIERSDGQGSCRLGWTVIEWPSHGSADLTGNAEPRADCPR
jgi:hypothetical protein